LPTKAAAEAWLRVRGFSATRVNKAKTKALAQMVCELHGVSDAEYTAGKRKTK
jgi:hypothetical protein